MGSFCAGNTNTQTQTNQQGTSAGQSQATGQTANTNTVAPTYGSEVGNTFAQIPGAYAPGQSLVQGAAAPTTFGQVSNLLSPFAASQVQANFASLQPLFQDQLSQLRGSQDNPYSSANLGAEARLRGQQANTLGNISSGIYNQSYGQALTATQADLARQLQAGATSGSLATQQLGLTPSLVNAGGQTSTGTGTTAQAGNTTGQTSNTGQSNSTTTYNPSLASVGLGLAGLFLKDGGAVRKRFDTGGAVTSGGPGGSDFASKVRAAFDVFHDMRKTAQNGGKMEPRYDEGGWVPTPDLGGPSSGDESYWNGVQSAAIANGNPSTSPFAPSSGMKDKLGSLTKAFEAPKTAAPAAAPLLPTTNPSLGALGNIMGAVANGMNPRARYDDGGWVPSFGIPSTPSLEAPSYLGAQTSDAPASPAASSAYDSTPSFASTLWSRMTGQPTEAATTPAQQVLRDNYGYDKPDRLWQLKRGLFGVSSGVPGLPGLFSSFGTAMDEKLKADQDAARLLEQHAQLTGRTLSGQPTVQAQSLALSQAKNPAEIANLNAHTALANMQADKAYQLELKKQEMEYAKQLAQQDLENKYNLVNRVMSNQPPQSGVRYKWVPQSQPIIPPEKQ